MPKNGWLKVVLWAGSIAVTVFLTWLAVANNSMRLQQRAVDHIENKGIHETENTKRARIEGIVADKLAPIQRDIQYIKEAIDRIERRQVNGER